MKKLQPFLIARQPFLPVASFTGKVAKRQRHQRCLADSANSPVRHHAFPIQFFCQIEMRLRLGKRALFAENIRARTPVLAAPGKGKSLLIERRRALRSAHQARQFALIGQCIDNAPLHTLHAIEGKRLVESRFRPIIAALVHHQNAHAQKRHRERGRLAKLATYTERLDQRLGCGVHFALSPARRSQAITRLVRQAADTLRRSPPAVLRRECDPLDPAPASPPYRAPAPVQWLSAFPHHPVGAAPAATGRPASVNLRTPDQADTIAAQAPRPAAGQASAPHYLLAWPRQWPNAARRGGSLAQRTEAHRGLYRPAASPAPLPQPGQRSSARALVAPGAPHPPPAIALRRIREAYRADAGVPSRERQTQREEAFGWKANFAAPARQAYRQ